MARIVHRRLAPASALPSAEPRGPGAALDSITWLGWLSGLAAFAVLVYTLRPLLEQGGPRAWDWGGVAEVSFVAVRNAAIVALPFALELGVPGARRLSPWLMRAAVLFALEQLSRPVIGQVQSFVFDTWFPDLQFGDPGTLPGFAFILAGFGASLLGIGGVWALADGLADAGARLARQVTIGVVAAGLALTLAAYLPLYLPAIDPASGASTQIIGLNVVAILLSFADAALWFLAAPRLVAGFARRLRPRRAWAMAAIAGAAMLALRLIAPVLVIVAVADPAISAGFRVAEGGSWVALFLAFALGLGRGRERRLARPTRMHLFVRNPAD